MYHSILHSYLKKYPNARMVGGVLDNTLYAKLNLPLSPERYVHPYAQEEEPDLPAFEDINEVVDPHVILQNIPTRFPSEYITQERRNLGKHSIHKSYKHPLYAQALPIDADPDIYFLDPRTVKAQKAYTEEQLAEEIADVEEELKDNKAELQYSIEQLEEISKTIELFPEDPQNAEMLQEVKVIKREIERNIIRLKKIIPKLESKRKVLEIDENAKYRIYKYNTYLKRAKVTELPEVARKRLQFLNYNQPQLRRLFKDYLKQLHYSPRDIAHIEQPLIEFSRQINPNDTSSRYDAYLNVSRVPMEYAPTDPQNQLDRRLLYQQFLIDLGHWNADNMYSKIVKKGITPEQAEERQEAFAKRDLELIKDQKHAKKKERSKIRKKLAEEEIQHYKKHGFEGKYGVEESKENEPEYRDPNPYARQKIKSLANTPIKKRKFIEQLKIRRRKQLEAESAPLIERKRKPRPRGRAI